MGVLPQKELIQSEKPLVDAIVTILGPSGGYVLAGLGLISLLGSTLGWVLLSAEVPYQAAKQGLFIPAFLKENKKKVPSFSLVLSNGLAQIFIFSTISNSMSAAFDFVNLHCDIGVSCPIFYRLCLPIETGADRRNIQGDGSGPHHRWGDRCFCDYLFHLGHHRRHRGYQNVYAWGHPASKRHLLLSASEKSGTTIRGNTKNVGITKTNVRKSRAFIFYIFLFFPLHQLLLPPNPSALSRGMKLRFKRLQPLFNRIIHPPPLFYSVLEGKVIRLSKQYRENS